MRERRLSLEGTVASVLAEWVDGAVGSFASRASGNLAGLEELVLLLDRERVVAGRSSCGKTLADLEAEMDLGLESRELLVALPSI